MNISIDNELDYEEMYRGLTDMRRSLDPVMLMRDAGYVADPWQERVLRSASPRMLLLCARQVGKSLTTACKALHVGIYTPGSTVILISRSQDQSDELFGKVIKIYDAVGRPVRAVRELVSEIIFDNGSRIVALPNNPDTVRGYSDVDLLIVDEASRVPHSVMVATLPMIMASRGKVILLSTPCGKNGFFYDAWSDAYGSWERITSTASECSRFDREMLDELRRELGEVMAAQELDCQFVKSGDQVFSSSSIDKAFESELPALYGF